MGFSFFQLNVCGTIGLKMKLRDFYDAESVILHENPLNQSRFSEKNDN